MAPRQTTSDRVLRTTGPEAALMRDRCGLDAGFAVARLNLQFAVTG
jgi:hypothetical protein